MEKHDWIERCQHLEHENAVLVNETVIPLQSQIDVLREANLAHKSNYDDSRKERDLLKHIMKRKDHKIYELENIKQTASRDQAKIEASKHENAVLTRALYDMIKPAYKHSSDEVLANIMEHIVEQARELLEKEAADAK